MAARALLHNGCTTGVEAYMLGVPAISYRPTVNEKYDNAFHRLPNLLSHECFNFNELRETLLQALSGRLCAAQGDKRKQIMVHHLASQKNALACERIVDVLKKISEDMLETPKPKLNDQLKGRYLLIRRRLRKKSRSLRSESHKKPELARHNYPGISLDELRERISRFNQVLGYGGGLKVDQISEHIYQISS
jgi:hypothetical protein